MKHGLFDQTAPVNPDRLGDELKAALGAVYDSVDTGVRENADSPDLKILVRLTDAATETDQTKVEAVLKAHDATKLSDSQQKEQARVDAFARFKAFDFAALRALKPAEQNPVIIGLLEDIQKLMQGTA